MQRVTGPKLSSSSSSSTAPESLDWTCHASIQRAPGGPPPHAPSQLRCYQQPGAGPSPEPVEAAAGRAPPSHRRGEPQRQPAGPGRQPWKPWKPWSADEPSFAPEWPGRTCGRRGQLQPAQWRWVARPSRPPSRAWEAGPKRQAAAPAGRALTCRVRGWEEDIEGMPDLLEVAGEDDGGGRSGGRRRKHSPRRHVALGWWASGQL
jgi:hypothetical protein